MSLRISQQPNADFRNFVFLFLSVAVLAIVTLPRVEASERDLLISQDQEEFPGPLPGTKLRAVLLSDIPALMDLYSSVCQTTCSKNVTRQLYRRAIVRGYSSVLIVNATSQETEILAFSTGQITKRIPGSITGYVQVCRGVL